MKHLHIILILALISTYGYSQETKPFTNLNANKFNELVKNNPGSLIDVRTQQEFNNGHLKAAGQLNYYSLNFNQKLLLLSKTEPIYLYCNTGYRSKKAAEFLALYGYTKVYNLEKGIMNWQLQNLPVVVEKNAEPFSKDKIEPDEYYNFIKSNKNVVVDFYAPWCSPCQKLLPYFDSLTKIENIDLSILKVNVDASKKLVRELKIASVPYILFYNKNKLINKHAGFLKPSEIDNLIKTNYH